MGVHIDGVAGVAPKLGSMAYEQTSSYFKTDCTVPLTGSYVKRDTNSGFVIYSGGAGNWGASLWLFGYNQGGSFAGGVKITATDASMIGYVDVITIYGNTDDPYIDMNFHQVKNIMTPSDSADAATMGYVETTFAPLLSPSLSGTPLAPTAPYGTNTTQIATTEFVNSALGGWNSLESTTDFATTAASTSTITMNTDKTAVIFVGSPIKFTLSGTEYFAICSAITASLLTISGAPLTTASGGLTALSYSSSSRVVQMTISIPGYYEETSYTSAPYALESLLGMRYGIMWAYTKAYLVKFSAIHRVADTGTAPIINVLVDGSSVCTSNSNNGLSMPTNNTSSVSTAVDIATGGTYRIQNGEFIEVKITKGTDTVKAQDLTITVVFVLP